jgi:hypothetical protein
MQRSKQQALMFLLGAVLVGGVLGFSADRIMAKKDKRPSARVKMYDDIGIDSAVRVRMDSLLDETNCKTRDLMRTLQPAIDSIKADANTSLLALMTDAQRTAFDAREKKFKAAMDSIDKVRDAEWAKKHPGVERPRGRCGSRGPRPAGAGPGPGTDRGPGGPLFR